MLRDCPVYLFPGRGAGGSIPFSDPPALKNEIVRRKARERICSSLSRTLQRNNSNPRNLHFFDFFLKTHVDVQRWIIRLAGRLFFRDQGTLNLKSTENGLCIHKGE